MNEIKCLVKAWMMNSLNMRMTFQIDRLIVLGDKVKIEEENLGTTRIQSRLSDEADGYFHRQILVRYKRFGCSIGKFLRGILMICWLSVAFACGDKDDLPDPENPNPVFDELGSHDLIDNSDELAYGATNGRIHFSGYEWDVKSSVANAIGPGPNYFSMNSKNVWVDKNGSLHLKITNRNDRWYSSSVSLPKPQGFGKYIIYVSDETEELDPNIVVGFFLYKSDTQEVDIELSRWGDADNRNAQFAVQPADRLGNKSRFDVWTEGYKTTYFIDWRRDSILFGGYKGITLHPKEENIFSSWIYHGKDIPDSEEEKFIINFWLFRGNPPIDNQEAEIVIDSVRFIKSEDHL